ncbi:hypothetical protein ACDZ28_01075 (plasmid) [Paenibacillus sp. RS8]|uniref:hypothetical protein n=1 Tax=Paenibacillus sp. RS8 TaxID=3242681 RepID=UPI0035C1B2C2
MSDEIIEFKVGVYACIILLVLSITFFELQGKNTAVQFLLGDGILLIIVPALCIFTMILRYLKIRGSFKASREINSIMKYTKNNGLDISEIHMDRINEVMSIATVHGKDGGSINIKLKNGKLDTANKEFGKP